MAFELSSFTKALSGAGARASLFEVTLTKTPVIATVNKEDTKIENDMKFNCRATTIPGMTITQIDTLYFGRTIKTPGDLEFADWTTTILNDNNYRVRRAIERWMASINSHSENIMNPKYGGVSPATTGKGTTGLDGGVYPWTGSAHIQQYNKLGTATHQYSLHHIWPTAIDPQDMSYDNTGTIQEYGITWSMDWWDYDGLKT